MSQDPELRELLAPMIERTVELDGPAFRVDRERVLARMAQAKSAPRTNVWGYAVLAVAGVAVLGFGAARWFGTSTAPLATLEVWVSEGSATRLGSTPSAVAPQQATQIEATGELETAASSKARLRTTDGMQIELQSQTRVALGELQTSARQLKLVTGSVRCTVPHRSSDHTFRVVTPDVTVVDVGTVFTVSIDPATHATRVSVEEGEVRLLRPSADVPLRAPNSWSSAAIAAPAPSAERPPEPAVLPESLPLAPSVKVGSHPSKAAGTTLAREAQLLRQGLAAERQGQAADAEVALTQLIQKYPQSPLVPDARAALARVRASAGH